MIVTATADLTVTMLYDIESRQPRARIKTVGDYHIEVIPMIFNWRVHTVRVDGGPWEWSERFWCYEGRGWDSYLAAVLAAHVWDGADDTEPAGWIKAWDGRRGEHLPVLSEIEQDEDALAAFMDEAARGVDAFLHRPRLQHRATLVDSPTS